MKKNLISLMLLLLVAALMVTFTGCKEEQPDDRDATIAQLQEENAALKAQVEALTAEIETMKQRAALQSWELSAAVWSDGNGATVTFTAIPVTYTTGQSAALSVRMGDLEAESAVCLWDADKGAFVGSVELSAVDGYSYYCILTSADGSQDEILLDSPENTRNQDLVYLGTALTTYANLVVDKWETAGEMLNVSTGFVQVQTPRLSADGSPVTIGATELVFKLNGEELERRALSLPQGEAQGSYEMTLENSAFKMPAMEDDYQLDLWLEVKLSSGNTISVCGGSWYYNSGELLLVVG